MNRPHLLALSFACLAMPSLALVAQQSQAGKILKSSGDEKAVAKDADAPGKASPRDDDPAPKESWRLKWLTQLQYDRRPSAILKLWAKPAMPAPKIPFRIGELFFIIPAPIDPELAGLPQDVTRGQWDAVKVYLRKLPQDEGDAGYKQLLLSLASGPSGRGSPDGPMMGPGMHPEMMRFQERNKFATDDVVGLAAAAPRGLDKDALTRIGAVLRQAVEGGQVVEHIVARLKTDAARPDGQRAFTQRQAALVLAAAGEAAHVGEFLPSPEKAAADKDHEALNLLTKHFLALHARDKKPQHLEKAWTTTQAVLSIGGAPRLEIEEGLRRAVELAPKIREELGQTWLDQSFTREPERGMDILATVGSVTANGILANARNPDIRTKALQLQKTALDALLKAAPSQAAEWRHTLTLLAGNWLREAEFAQLHDHSAGRGQNMRRDRYGNIFYMNEDYFGPGQMMQREQNMPLPVKVVDVLDARPTEPWLKQIDAGVRPKVADTVARLYLKSNEESQAFPYIEILAKSHPDKARTLVKEFLNVWTRTHDLNSDRNPQFYNPYLFFYGFNRQAESIPLTRSKQERNLDELSGWVKKLGVLELGEIDQELLAKAFTTCHSSAEVYRTEAIEKVFGPIAGLKPKTFGALAQQMRENLAGVWREPGEQQKKKTNRKTKDIQAEVERGYAVARTVVDKGRKEFPAEWSLRLAHAALLHDENNYRQELAKSTDFSPKRQEAMAEFQKSAALYGSRVKDLPEDEETIQAYEQWFYASLGACDLKHVNEERQPDLRQPKLIRAAILALPGEAAERHMGKFANTLFTRLSAVAPAVKYRYLRAGLEIVGDHKQARDAVKMFDYYKDLITEIKLEAALDGNDVVGNTQPFGVFVNLRHTREIERESGGFGRYLQNQNSMSFYYNFGRPMADYRDKFTAIVNEAMKEHFEVLSVTFQTDKVNSRALPEYGWRYTPYAYLLLKAKGPQIDKLPPLRLDLDFIESSGYVIIPIESPALPLDASAKAEPRPLRKLKLTQILDERQADKGKLLLEVKATGIGLIPTLDKVLDLAPAGFEIVKTDDQGVSVSQFDADGDHNGVVCERNWMVALAARPGETPQSFRFGTARFDDTEMTYQHYQDADLANAEPEISLEQAYGSRDYRWLWAGAGGGVLLLVGGFVAFRQLRKPRALVRRSWELPEPLTPFTVLILLRQMETSALLAEPDKVALRRSIADIERHFFAIDGNGELDLKGVAQTWIRKLVSH